MKRFDYYSDWCEYTYPEISVLSDDSDIRSGYCRVDLSDSGRYPSGGIPLLVTDRVAYLNDRTENTIIFGETGSKKTRTVIAPLIMTTAGAGESAFVTDIKGELWGNRKLRGFLEERGINTVCIDFRSFKGDSVNILEYPFMLYRNGDRDKALAECSAIFSALGDKYRKTDDPFWSDSAMMYLKSIIEIVFILGVENDQAESVNMFSLSRLANMKSAYDLSKLVKENESVFREKMTPMGFSMLESIVMNPAEKTLGCIMSFVQSMIQPFVMEPKLTEMLSRTTFDIDSIYEKPTCVFLIVPDETSAYDSIAGLLIDNFYTRLIEKYSRVYTNKNEAPCRINFICDEFCNMFINDMKAKISASRGRNMRWFLVCQSKDQLEKSYGEHAGTIIGNCRNTLFLQSSDKQLLDYICDLCGETGVVDKGGSERLVTPKMLKGLRKETAFKEAVFIDGNTVYFAKLPDIDSYDMLKKYSGSRSSGKANKSCAGSSVAFFTANDVFDAFCPEEYDIWAAGD